MGLCAGASSAVTATRIRIIEDRLEQLVEWVLCVTPRTKVRVTMSIYSTIVNAIFQSSSAMRPEQSESNGQDACAGVQHNVAEGQSPQMTPAQVLGPLRQTVSRQRLEEILAGMAVKRGGAFNWNESIVDLMKLLDLDSSLEARHQLAQELGYQGERDGSPEMTDWLHKQVMARLVEGHWSVAADLGFKSQDGMVQK